MPQGFDVKAARAAGYSDDEILGHLTTTRKFDVDGAIKAGYSKPEMIDHLAGLDNTSAIVKSQEKFTVPGSTIGSRAREFALGGLEAMGVDLKNPITGTLKNLTSVPGKLYQDFKADPSSYLVLPKLMQKLAQPTIEAGRETIQGFREGDYDKAAHGGGGILGNVAPLLMGEPESRAAAGTAIEKVGALPAKAAGKAVEVVSGVPMQSEKAMVKAIKPRSGNLQFETGLQRSMPELKLAESRMGKPIQGVDDLIEATKDAKQNIWKQYEQIQGPQAQRGVDASPVAEAIQKSVPLKTRIQNPALAEKLNNVAATYKERPFKIGELEDMLHTTNAQLDAYYDKYPTAKRSLAASNPDTAHLVAEGKALRDTIYNALDQAGGGAAPRELKQRYGSLLNLEEEAYRRRNVAARQQPESLTEQMGRLHAGVKVGGAILKLPFDPAGAAIDIGSAVGGRKIARAIKEANSADNLIKKAMERYRGMPTPVDYSPVRPKALLGPGPFQMGPVSEGKTLNVETVPWGQMRPPVRKALPSASTDVQASVRYGPTGPYEMPPVPPKLLGEGQKMLPANAGSPHVTPLRESLLEKVRRLQKHK